MTDTSNVRIGMFGLGVCYFLWYAPYSAVAKAMSGGLFEVTGGPIGGLVILPASAIGMLLAMPLALTILGWWRYARRRTFYGVSVPVPGPETAASAFWMAWIVGTTTMNFTFPGASILFVLVLMRIETLLLSPSIDFAHRRKIHVHSWVAVGLSLLSAGVALSDVKNYHLTAAAIASLLLYLLGYTNRFLIMSRHAKRDRLDSDRRYLVEEHMTTPVFLVAILAALALAGPEAMSSPLREGFTTLLISPAVLPALAIGVFYEGLFICTTLIFLDRREFSFCMPVHVCASMLAGVAASFVLMAVYGRPPPSSAQVLAAVCVITAAFALSYPAIRARLARRKTKRVFLFVCGGNTIRSPIAAAVALSEFLAAGERCEAWSAGVSVPEPGKPLEPAAADALRQLGISVPQHASRPLTAELCARSNAVYCMTRGHRESVIRIAPEASARVLCLDPKADIPDPHGDASHSYLEIASRIRESVRARLLEQARSGLLRQRAHYSRVAPERAA